MDYPTKQIPGALTLLLLCMLAFSTDASAALQSGSAVFSSASSVLPSGSNAFSRGDGVMADEPFIKPADTDASTEWKGLIARDGTSDVGSAPSPMAALFRSLVVPGWGHYYADSGNWRRGQLHLGAEVVLLASYLGIYRQSYVLEKNMYTHASAYSGTDIRAQDREFELAVGGYRSLADYNDYQERTRNLDRLFPDEPAYRWEWESDELRREYLDLRSRRDDLDQQLPALVALMVANRVISGISAYSRAASVSGSGATVHLEPGPSWRGWQAVISFTF